MDDLGVPTWLWKPSTPAVRSLDQSQKNSRSHAPRRPWSDRESPWSVSKMVNKSQVSMKQRWPARRCSPSVWSEAEYLWSLGTLAIYSCTTIAIYRCSVATIPILAVSGAKFPCHKSFGHCGQNGRIRRCPLCASPLPFSLRICQRACVFVPLCLQCLSTLSRQCQAWLARTNSMERDDWYFQVLRNIPALKHSSAPCLSGLRKSSGLQGGAACSQKPLGMIEGLLSPQWKRNLTERDIS